MTSRGKRWGARTVVGSLIAAGLAVVLPGIAVGISAKGDAIARITAIGPVLSIGTFLLAVLGSVVAVRAYVRSTASPELCITIRITEENGLSDIGLRAEYTPRVWHPATIPGQGLMSQEVAYSMPTPSPLAACDIYVEINNCGDAVARSVAVGVELHGLSVPHYEPRQEWRPLEADPYHGLTRAIYRTSENLVIHRGFPRQFRLRLVDVWLLPGRVPEVTVRAVADGVVPTDETVAGLR